MLWLILFLTRATSSMLDNVHNHYQVKLETVPHHVMIVYKNAYCSGSLVSSRVVITAASCFHLKENSTQDASIREIIEVSEVKLHEFYKNLIEVDNDIALCFLKKHANLSNQVKKGVIWEPHWSAEHPAQVHVTGWGGTNLPPKFVNKLVWTEMTILSKMKCREFMLMTPSSFCLEYAVDHRLSDNGGSVLINDKIAGLISFGANRKSPPYIAIATNVTYFHRWIKLNVVKFSYDHCVYPTYSDDESYAEEYEYRPVYEYKA